MLKNLGNNWTDGDAAIIYYFTSFLYNVVLFLANKICLFVLLFLIHAAQELLLSCFVGIVRL